LNASFTRHPRNGFYDAPDANFTIEPVPARRMINPDAAKRGEITEIIVTNY